LPTTWTESSVNSAPFHRIADRGQAMKPLERPSGGAKSTPFKIPD
jgi:hypothetical protein